MDVELVTNLKQRMVVSKRGTEVRAVELSRLFLWAASGLFQERLWGSNGEGSDLLESLA